MTPTEAQPTLFEDLAADLPGPHKAEFFQNLHQVGIGPNDVELARLLRSLQLYKAYYESIPAAVREAASEIERLTADARRSSEACARMAGQVVQEAERFRQDLEQIRAPVEGAAAGERQNATLARRNNARVCALVAFVVACALTLASWFALHRWYLGRIEAERAALVRQIDKNREVLLELAESNRTLELVRDPDRPRRRLLVMKDAAGWQSKGNHGVIEFYR